MIGLTQAYKNFTPKLLNMPRVTFKYASKEYTALHNLLRLFGGAKLRKSKLHELGFSKFYVVFLEQKLIEEEKDSGPDPLVGPTEKLYKKLGSYVDLDE